MIHTCNSLTSCPLNRHHNACSHTKSRVAHCTTVRVKFLAKSKVYEMYTKYMAQDFFFKLSVLDIYMEHAVLIVKRATN